VVEAHFVRAGDEVQAGQVVARLRLASGEPGAGLEVQSLAAGRILETLTAPGSVVGAGDGLATLEDTRQPLEAVLYVPADAAGDLRPGQPVQLSPDSVSRAAHSYLAGTVRAVGAFPASPEAMLAVLANDRLAAAFSAGGAPIEVRVAVSVDAEGAYRWSSGQAPADPLLGGAVCTGQIITAERRPIEWLWPGR
jgi:pyruvate/2-oxoglutarate dehydrogenase complex dihydrolipoamide acyltransferase (E2) component